MKTSRCAGLSLVELAIALGIAGFCLVAIFGLLPVGLNSNHEAVEQSRAMNLISALAADLRATDSAPASSGTSAQYGMVIPPASAASVSTSGTLFVTQEGVITGSTNARYRVQYWINPPVIQQTANRTATKARILVTWPAAPSAQNATGKAEALLCLDRN